MPRVPLFGVRLPMAWKGDGKASGVPGVREEERGCDARGRFGTLIRKSKKEGKGEKIMQLKKEKDQQGTRG